ncbi:MAG: protein kinase [Polyangiaceae bacterium]
MRKARGTSPPLVPERIGRYEVLLPIASGGMGTVYLARNRGVGGFEQDVALKVMHAHLREEEHFSDDLVEEAKLAVRIRHPNVVRVQDVGEDPHGVYLVMDYVEGDSLAGLLRAAREDGEGIPTRVGLRILYDALLGLHAAHELQDKNGELVGVVHRDFSPQNILVGVDGISRLTDFGVAKAKTRLSHTATGLVKGKIHYMAPEQAKTEPIDRRCDIWAAGVIAWELIARRRLYKDRNEAAILLQLITEPPPRLRTVNAKVPQPLEDAVAHALSADVNQRCPDAATLAAALAQGATATGGLATTEEVSVLVRRLAGSHIRHRHEQASQVLQLRASISNIAQEVTAGSEVTTPSHFGSTPPTGVSAIEAPTSEEATELTSTSESMVPKAGRKRNPRLLAALAAASVVGLGVALASSLSGDEPPAASPAPVSPTPTSEPMAEPSATAAPEVAPLTVAVSANAAVTDLVLGERAIAAGGKESFEIVLRPEEQQAETRVRAIAKDGRRIETTWKPGEERITLRFEDKATVAPPPVSQPKTTMPPLPKPKPTAAPLAPNPFDQQ